MKIVENKYFEKEFPLEVTRIMNDVTVFMNYDFMVRFKPDEKEIIWKQIKELKVDADQVVIDSEGYEYVGW
jgi:hypothetical protein